MTEARNSEQGARSPLMRKRDHIVEMAKAISPFVSIPGFFLLLGVSIYQFFGSGPPAEYVKPAIAFSVVGVLSFVGLVIFLVRFSRDKATVTEAKAAKDEADRKLFAAATKINEILAIDSAHCAYIRRNRDAGLHELQAQFSAYSSDVLSLIRELFTTYTGYDCAACIKALNLSDKARNHIDFDTIAKDTELPYVYTLGRDLVSKVHRSHVDSKPGLNIYRYTKNSGLTFAMKDSKGYWQSNDLKGLGATYWNGNPDWDKHYNAVAVVMLRNPFSEDDAEAVGFLCVDNKGGGFDDVTCKEFMEILANIVYYTLRMYTRALEQIGGQHDQQEG